MKLNNKSLKDNPQWAEKGYFLPGYDREAMIKRTKEEPHWIHFGAGNIFRAFHAKAAQQLLNDNLIDYGLIAAECRSSELAEKIFRPYDNLTVLVEFMAGGEIKKTVIGSIAEVCSVGDSSGGFERMKEIFRSPSLQLASLTITEKGYKLTDSSGQFLPEVKNDFENGADEPSSFMGKIAALLYERFLCGGLPLAMVSMDNCSDNGGTLYKAVMEFAEKWTENKLIKQGFDRYICSDAVSFPLTMIDKITPRPDLSVEEELLRDGIDDIKCVTTSKNTYAAAYVNAEETGYLVIEDSFPNGRPPFEKCGFYMTDKDTVRLTEKMKVSTCLNPLHTALAVFGCLMGYDRICKEAENPLLKELICKIGYSEGLPAVSSQSIIDPNRFLDEVINVRLPNPHLPDTPQRIATDTSMKLSVRFGETLKWYAEKGKREAAELKFIPLVIAGWLRYLMSVNDRGDEFERSSDPFLADNRAEYLHSLKLGDEFSEEIINQVLSDEDIFGLDLCKTPVACKIIEYFRSMISSVGAVESTLKSVIEG